MTEALEPPSYDGFGYQALINSSQAATSDLPVYSRRPSPPPPTANQVEREPREFVYEAKTRLGGGVPWATLTVQGDPRLTRVIPTITEGSNLVGSVKLALRSPEAIQAICILIKGEVVQGGPANVAIPTFFVETKHTIWSATEGDPQAPEGSGKSKLKGDYVWPFSLPIPSTVTKDGQTWRTPHSFVDTIASFSIRYTAELRIVRGKLRPDDKVSCTFAYFSMQQPGPPSPLRQLAYQENSPLFGPEVDPEGWLSQSVTVRGIVFASRQIEATITLSLAKPLCYTRSASIPCVLSIECKDSQALDLLSSPSAPMLYLERSFLQERDAWRNSVESCGRAVFWPSTEGASPSTSSPPTRRDLMGEIHLKANLQPSSSVCGFSVEYAVVLFPFQATAFKPLVVGDLAPLLRQIVEITTRYAPGPRQRTYTPATYDTRNNLIDHYYYALVIQNAQAGARVRAGGRGGR
ncbi:hypothetical protein R3P38DRAFT_3040562 [Favolaschia claudopus]|uniref:Arrestin-like N-terminal domain-containing protein n=1 Tax=Favolaschia claudopus TaxID=2862362 RepID=A0AAW0AAW9_9AGAR